MSRMSIQERIQHLIAVRYKRKVNEHQVIQLATVCADLIAAHFDDPPEAGKTQTVNGKVAKGIGQ